ncbi:MAG TPA: hypothetical protein VJU16_01435 [Planctomycetota bacterium]|nr:hypothetical protein [Planctomycetota bacterium]
MITLTLIALVAGAQAKELTFDAPENATDAQVQQAAKALTARCEALDLKGVRAAAESKRIRVTCPKDLPDEKVEAVGFLATFPAAKMELRIIHKVGKADAEKYPHGKEAPDGATWVKVFEWERTETDVPMYRKSDSDLFWLFRTKPLLDATGKIKVLQHAGGEFHRKKLEAGIYLQFSKELTRALFASITKDPDAPANDVLLVAILVDGVKITTGDGAMRWYITTNPNDGKTPDTGLWEIEELTKSRTLQVLLKHPLPFALKEGG